MNETKGALWMSTIFNLKLFALYHIRYTRIIINDTTTYMFDMDNSLHPRFDQSQGNESHPQGAEQS